VGGVTRQSVTSPPCGDPHLLDKRSPHSTDRLADSDGRPRSIPPCPAHNFPPLNSTQFMMKMIKASFYFPPQLKELTSKERPSRRERKPKATDIKRKTCSNFCWFFGELFPDQKVRCGVGWSVLDKFLRRKKEDTFLPRPRTDRPQVLYE